MRSIWLFRTNLRELEYYHQYKKLEEFKLKTHDFYLMMGIQMLEKDYCSHFVVWRLMPKKPVANYNFILPNGGIFSQRFVSTFEDIFNPIQHNISKTPDISFFRGGFQEYDQLVKRYPNGLGKTLYLGAGKRISPRFGGKYDIILVEGEKEKTTIQRSMPYYKTCNPNVFNYQNLKKEYDICFISNFTQKSYKGQQFFIESIAKSKFLKSLKIVHIGNKPQIGIKMCKKNNINNIEFKGLLNREEITTILNKSKFGIVCSNETDGCPRVITEIMCCGNPLLIRKNTRLLDYYKNDAVVVFKDKHIEQKIKSAFNDYDQLKENAINNLKNKMTIDKICKMNYTLWKSI